MEYEHIHFVKLSDKPRTSVWSCRNNNSGLELGEVEWYPSWRQYCFCPNAGTVFSGGCLADIQDFIKDRADDRGEIHDA